MAEANWRAARLQARSLSESAATVSAGRLHAVAREMESAAESTEGAGFDQLLTGAVAEFEALRYALEQAGWA